MKLIKTFRQNAGLTQFEVSRKLGITERAYQRIEAGGSTPNVLLAQRLASILGATIETLFSKDIKQESDVIEANKKLYDVDEFRSEILNNKVSKSTIYAKIKSGEIKAVKIGRKPFIPAWFVDELLTSRNI